MGKGLKGVFKTLGSIKCPLELSLYGDKGYKRLVFADSFHAFKRSLEVFTQVIRTKSQPIARAETLEIVEIIEKRQWLKPFSLQEEPEKLGGNWWLIL